MLMRSIAVLIAVLFASFSAEADTSYTYKAVFLERKAPIVINGDLSDWEGLGVEAKPLKNICTYGGGRRLSPPINQMDLSASFGCFADPDNFYVAVVVRDDKVIMGEEPFGRTHHDDSVEIYFDGDLVRRHQREGQTDYDANDAQIRCTKDKHGKVVLEGTGLFGGRLFIFPGLWESLGIVAAIKTSSMGYIVEMKVPKGVFVSVPLGVGVNIGFNVMVNDDDDGGNRDSKISWTADLSDKSYMSTRHFGSLKIDRKGP
ncbi:MAG TPA: hypothetical protein EYP53_05455 [Candidatus Latescibacteria bacterium]|nr:hypothetical protein [Candidatus Latescibacterota bacterium]